MNKMANVWQTAFLNTYFFYDISIQISLTFVSEGPITINSLKSSDAYMRR